MHEVSNELNSSSREDVKNIISFSARRTGKEISSRYPSFFLFFFFLETEFVEIFFSWSSRLPSFSPSLQGQRHFRGMPQQKKETGGIRATGSSRRAGHKPLERVPQRRRRKNQPACRRYRYEESVKPSVCFWNSRTIQTASSRPSFFLYVAERSPV